MRGQPISGKYVSAKIGYRVTDSLKSVTERKPFRRLENISYSVFELSTESLVANTEKHCRASCLLLLPPPLG